MAVAEEDSEKLQFRSAEGSLAERSMSRRSENFGHSLSKEIDVKIR